MAQIIKFPRVKNDNTAKAYKLYYEASKLDDDESTALQALGMYFEAIKMDPWLDFVYTNIGNIYYRRNDLVEAKYYYEKAIELNANQAESLYNLGYMHMEMLEYEAAIALFSKSLSVDPGFADCIFNLAVAYERSGDESNAKFYYNKYIAVDPDSNWGGIAKNRI